MSKVKFIFCTHNHQPIGNFGWVFEKTYQSAYKPFFLDVLSKHSDVKWNLHLIGILWEYLEREHKDYVKIVQDFIDKEKTGILSGGYFEPIMSSLPDKDKPGQNREVNEIFEK